MAEQFRAWVGAGLLNSMSGGDVYLGDPNFTALIWSKHALDAALLAWTIAVATGSSWTPVTQ